MFDRAVGAQSKMVQSALDQQKDSKMEVTADWQQKIGQSKNEKSTFADRVAEQDAQTQQSLAQNTMMPDELGDLMQVAQKIDLIKTK